MAEEKKEKREVSPVARFFHGVKSEYKKIIWPTREDLGKQTLAVISVSVVLGAVIAALDWLFQMGFSFIIK